MAACLPFRCCAVAAFVIVTAGAAEWTKFVPPSHTLRVDVPFVLVPVTVTDAEGGIVAGLTREQFEIQEDGVRQEIVSFHDEDRPCSVGVVFDASGSMRGKISDSRLAIRALLAGAHVDDEVLLVSFADRPEAPTGFTSRFQRIQHRLLFEEADGKTALIDAVYQALDAVREGRHARKALVIFSDGLDNNSRYTAGDLMTAAIEADTQVHTVAFYSAPAHTKPLELTHELQGLRLLQKLSAATGGLHFVVSRTQEAIQAMKRIGRALHSQYVLGYRSPADNPRQTFRRIEVKVAVPDLRPYFRSGYFPETP